MSKEIIEGNKLIADFMCNQYVNHVGKTDRYKWQLVKNGSWYEEKDLLYNKSWDWLIPVVEKIESLREDIGFMVVDWFEVHRFGNTCIIKSGLRHADDTIKSKFYYEKSISSESEILCVWESVVEFIKWYNLCQREK